MARLDRKLLCGKKGWRSAEGIWARGPSILPSMAGFPIACRARRARMRSRSWQMAVVARRRRLIACSIGEDAQENCIKRMDE